MYEKKQILAIIPARAGSKRLPNKNIKNIAGKPLISWTMAAAKKSKYIDKIIVSTDSSEIIELAKKFNIDIPFVRPAELANDIAKMSDVVKHTIEFLANNLCEYFDYIMLLQPTSPLRDQFDIDNSIELCFNKKADAVVSVCETEHSPLWCNVLPTDLSMDNFISEKITQVRSQDLPKYYRLNGAIYFIKTERFREEKTFILPRNTYAYTMTREKSVDIDCQIDMLLAEVLLMHISKNGDT